MIDTGWHLHLVPVDVVYSVLYVSQCRLCILVVLRLQGLLILFAVPGESGNEPLSLLDMCAMVATLRKELILHGEPDGTKTAPA